LAVQRRSRGDPLALGQVAAPVVISEWLLLTAAFYLTSAVLRGENATAAPAFGHHRTQVAA
jgi:hypothetical protein